MSSFDIIESAGSGYKLIVMERRYLLSLAFVPFVIKLVCHLAVGLLGWETNYIRQALVLLPSYFADGWMLAHLVRLIFFGQRWPFKPVGRVDEDMAQLQDRAAGIVTGTLVYVLMKYFTTGFMSVLMYINQQAETADASNVDASLGTLLVALMLIMIIGVWSLKFLWLYIPASVNLPLKSVLHGIRGFKLPLCLLGTWLVCCFPLIFIVDFLVVSYEMSAGVPFEDAMGMPVMVVVRSVLSTLVEILPTAGIAFGFYSLFSVKQS